MQKQIPIVISGFILLLVLANAWGADVIINQADNVKSTGELLEKKYKIEKEKKETQKTERVADAQRALKIGDAYLQQGDILKAAEYYQMAIDLDPLNSEAHQKNSQISTQRDALEKKIGLHYHMAMQYVRKGNKTKAIDELIQAIQLHPENTKARMKLNELEQK